MKLFPNAIVLLAGYEVRKMAGVFEDVNNDIIEYKSFSPRSFHKNTHQDKERRCKDHVERMIAERS